MHPLQKYTLSFILAISLHLFILGLFVVNFGAEKKDLIQKPIPEIIQASVLDDKKIIAEARRLKTKEKNKQLARQKRQKILENRLKREQALLQNTRKKRVQAEKEAQKIKQKNKQQAKREKRKLEEIKNKKILETARLAKIKAQRIVAKKRLNDLQVAEQKKQRALLAKQKAEAEKKARLLIEKAKALKAQNERNSQAIHSATVAIQRKVNNHWIKPLSSRTGLNCTIRVELLSSGDVMVASVIKSSGDDIFDRSAENAVRKASPLPIPKNRNLFAKQFKTFIFKFKPEG